MSTHTNHNDLQNELKNLFAPRTEENEIKHDEFMLMAAFLSEIEFIQNKQNISRKQLAKMIKTSPSYLTQVFRSKKPLNFLTLAKMKRALNIRFDIRGLDLNETFTQQNQEYIPISYYTFIQQHTTTPNIIQASPEVVERVTFEITN